MKIEAYNDDVVSMDSSWSFVGTKTFKLDQFGEDCGKRLGASSVMERWFGEGVECEFLSARTGQGWKKGKIRLRYEFVPDEANNPDSLDSLREHLNTEE